MSDVTYNQEQLNEAIEKAKQEWIEKELKPVLAERDELLKYKPKELSEEEEAIKAKEQELFQKEVLLILKENGLEKFAEFFYVESIDELKEKIKKFQSILDELKLSYAYVPTDHKQTDQYSQAKSKGDTIGMIKALFS